MIFKSRYSEFLSKRSPKTLSYNNENSQRPSLKERSAYTCFVDTMTNDGRREDTSTPLGRNPRSLDTPFCHLCTFFLDSRIAVTTRGPIWLRLRVT